MCRQREARSRCRCRCRLFVDNDNRTTERSQIHPLCCAHSCDSPVLIETVSPTLRLIDITAHIDDAVVLALLVPFSPNAVAHLINLFSHFPNLYLFNQLFAKHFPLFLFVPFGHSLEDWFFPRFFFPFRFAFVRNLWSNKNIRSCNWTSLRTRYVFIFFYNFVSWI